MSQATGHVKGRLEGVRSCSTDCLPHLPFIVVWEAVRVAVHCGVNRAPETDIFVDPNWVDTSLGQILEDAMSSLELPGQTLPSRTLIALPCRSMNVPSRRLKY